MNLKLHDGTRIQNAIVTEAKWDNGVSIKTQCSQCGHVSNWWSTTDLFKKCGKCDSIMSFDWAGI
jgi:hypothetical protein